MDYGPHVGVIPKPQGLVQAEVLVVLTEVASSTPNIAALLHCLVPVIQGAVSEDHLGLLQAQVLQQADAQSV